MTSEETFLSALHDDPGDEVTWHALADWLEEAGQCERAEVVRLTRRLRALPVRRTKSRASMEDRLVELLNTGVRPAVPEIANSIGMRFALIPPGRFRMGSPRKEKDRSPNETTREVELTTPFYLGVFPVTQKQYETVTGTNPSHFSRNGGRREKVRDISDEELAEFPVEWVSWEDAENFLKKLSRRAEEKKARRRYRLPTEAEWEYACRAGGCSTTAVHFGCSLSPIHANFNSNHPYGDVEKGEYLERTSRVGSYPPNAFGLYDMHGNVWEWCSDWDGDHEGEPAIDPKGPDDGTERVIRGGCWAAHGRYCRTACRRKGSPSTLIHTFGFRAACDIAG